MIQISSDTDIEMNRNNSDWLGMNPYAILSPGKLRWIEMFVRIGFRLIWFELE